MVYDLLKAKIANQIQIKSVDIAELLM